MTLREEVLNLTESKAEKIKLSSYKKQVKIKPSPYKKNKGWDEIFQELFDNAKEQKDHSWYDFASDETLYNKWYNREIVPVLKKYPEAKGPFKDWERQLMDDV